MRENTFDVPAYKFFAWKINDGRKSHTYDEYELLISNNKFIQYNKKNNLIYKQLGYDKNILIKINYLESIIITFVSFIISIIICLVLYITVSNNYGAQIKLQMPLFISYLAIIISFLLTLGISLLSWYLAIKNNNSIIGEFRDAEI